MQASLTKEAVISCSSAFVETAEVAQEANLKDVAKRPSFSTLLKLAFV